MAHVMTSQYLILKNTIDGYECRINIGDSMYVKIGDEYKKIILFNIQRKYTCVFNYHHLFIIGFVPNNVDEVIEVPIEDAALDRGNRIEHSEDIIYDIKYSYVAIDDRGYPLHIGDYCKIVTLMQSSIGPADLMITSIIPDGQYINGTITDIDDIRIMLKTPNGVSIRVPVKSNEYLLYKYI